ncbi:Serine/threonine-protein phosphatase 7 long form [Glycine soja]
MSVAWCAVVPLMCFQVVEWHQPDRVLRQFGLKQPILGCPSQPLNLHGITLKGKQDENWGQLFAPMISQWNNRIDFRVNGYPRQEGLLSFNSDYMVWYRRKIKIFVYPKNANTTTLAEVAETLQYMVSPQGRNTWTVDDLVPYVEKITILSEEQERIAEPVSHGPATEHQFPAQQFHILHSSVETQGIGRRREAVEAKEYSQQMMKDGHGICISILSKVSTLILLQANICLVQHDAPIPTPNVPLGMQWNVPGAIPDMGDLLGVDLRHQFSAEADQVEVGRHWGKRNPDRQARRWDRPCGTSSHGSSQSISFLILVDFGRPFARIVVGSGISFHASSEGRIAASFHE